MQASHYKSKGVNLMGAQAVIALVVGTVVVLFAPALVLSPEIADRMRRFLARIPRR